MSVDETTISQWAARHQCRSSLPVLIRRLIRETTPGLIAMRFPGNEAVDLPGLDGRVETAGGTIWVPAGISYWEMGCNQNHLKKANDDYIKRTAETPEEVRLQCGFLFVTPRRWSNKDEWLEERRAEADWATVTVYDAIDLETWLEEAAVTSHWLLEKLGRLLPGFLTADEWWGRWASASTPPISARMVSSRKFDESDELIRRIRNDESVISVVANDRKEAVAFVIGSLMEAEANEVLDRILVATVGNTVFPSGDVRLIAITDISDGSELEFQNRGNTTIIRPYPKSAPNIANSISLSHVPSDVMSSELVAMGVLSEEARRVAIRAGHSVPVLRRQLSEDPEVRRPVWARDRASATRMLPFVLAGSWSERADFIDSEIIQLLGNITVEEITSLKMSLLDHDDAPIANFADTYIVVSQLDAYFAVGPYIDSEQINRYFELLPELLIERDPALDLPEEYRWMANVLGKGSAYSSAMLKGLGDSLCILALHGQQVCGDRLRLNIPVLVGELVRKVALDADEERWYTIRGHLKTLAEAAPSEFLSCIETDLQKASPCISVLMDVSDGYDNECLYANLLWSLETLAWHTEYFERVAKILFELQKIPIKGKWSNSPMSTLRSLFRIWSPSTSLNSNSRIEVLRQLSEHYRSPSFDIFLTLVRVEGIAMQGAKPEWRVLEEIVGIPTRSEVIDSIKQASGLLLDWTPYSQSELSSVIGVASYLAPEDFDRLVDEVGRWAGDADDFAKAEVLQDLRHFNVMLTRQESEATPEFIAAMVAMERALAPTISTARNRWLFDDPHVEWSELVEKENGERLPWNEREALVKQKRKDALSEIIDEFGEDEVLNLAMNVKRPNLVAWVLLVDEADPDKAAVWIDKALTLESSNASCIFLSQLLVNAGLYDLIAVVKILRDDGQLEDGSKLKRLAENLPGNLAGWAVAEELGGEVPEIYWKTTIIRCWHDTPPEQVVYAAEQLLKAQRPRSAFWAAVNSIDSLDSDLWVQILGSIADTEEAGITLPNASNLNDVLEYIEQSGKIPIYAVANLELQFAELLCRHRLGGNERILAIHRHIANEPQYFLQLLRWCCGRRDRADDSESGMSTDQRTHLARLSKSVLDDWEIIPGLDEDGEVVKEIFDIWADEVFAGAIDMDRLQMAEIKFAAMLASAARPLTWNRSMPMPLIDYLERTGGESFRHAFEVGVQNARGISVRGPYDGGGQERGLVSEYRELAAACIGTHTNVSGMLLKIAAIYEGEARYEDDRAEVGERWRE